MKKVIKGKNYGSIPHISSSRLGQHDKYLDTGQEKIIFEKVRDKHDRIIATLKLDGTNVGILRKGNELIAIQRKGYDCVVSPYKQHHEFDMFVQLNKKLFMSVLEDGQRMVGEWCYQVHSIEYTIIGMPFFCVDIFDVDGQRLEYNEVVFKCIMYGISIPVLLWDTDLHGQFQFDLAWKNRDYSKIKPIGEDHEGMVIRVERKGKFDFAAKWVRSDYEPGKHLNTEPIKLNRII